jgi:hypothetical protein
MREPFGAIGEREDIVLAAGARALLHQLRDADDREHATVVGFRCDR